MIALELLLSSLVGIGIGISARRLARNCINQHHLGAVIIPEDIKCNFNTGRDLYTRYGNLFPRHLVESYAGVISLCSILSRLDTVCYDHLELLRKYQIMYINDCSRMTPDNRKTISYMLGNQCGVEWVNDVLDW